jgi:hypothetical protein
MDDRPAPSVTFWEIPFQQRWEHLRPTITQLYVDEDKSLEDVVKTMKDEHGFDAVYMFSIRNFISTTSLA